MACRGLVACAPPPPAFQGRGVAGPASGTPRPAIREELRLTFVGDVMAHAVNYSRKPYEPIFQEVAGLLRSDDATFANLEFPIDGAKPCASYPRFNIHPDYVETALSAGLEVLSIANNHICDQGLDSLQATVATLQELQTKYPIVFGGLRPDPAVQFVTIPLRIKDWRIGWLAVTTWINSRAPQPECAAAVQRIAWKDPRRRAELLDFIRQEAPRYDLYLLSLHGGAEYHSTPTDGHRQLMYDLVRAGVSILWAHHPHVLQPWEIVTHQGVDRLILFSTGNLISGQGDPVTATAIDHPKAATLIGALFQVTVNGHGQIRNVTPVLTANYRSTTTSPFVIRQLEPLVRDPSIGQPWQQFYRTWLQRAQDIVKARPPVRLD